eukprot:3273338-Amphidinium_carterae.1
MAISMNSCQHLSDWHCDIIVLRSLALEFETLADKSCGKMLVHVIDVVSGDVRRGLAPLAPDNGCKQESNSVNAFTTQPET